MKSIDSQSNLLAMNSAVTIHVLGRGFTRQRQVKNQPVAKRALIPVEDDEATQDACRRYERENAAS